MTPEEEKTPENSQSSSTDRTSVRNVLIAVTVTLVLTAVVVFTLFRAPRVSEKADVVSFKQMEVSSKQMAVPSGQSQTSTKELHYKGETITWPSLPAEIQVPVSSIEKEEAIAELKRHGSLSLENCTLECIGPTAILSVETLTLKDSRIVTNGCELTIQAFQIKIEGESKILSFPAGRDKVPSAPAGMSGFGGYDSSNVTILILDGIETPPSKQLEIDLRGQDGGDIVENPKQQTSLPGGNGGKGGSLALYSDNADAQSKIKFNNPGGKGGVGNPPGSAGESGQKEITLLPIFSKQK